MRPLKQNFENKKPHIWFHSISKYLILAFLYLSQERA